MTGLIFIIIALWLSFKYSISLGMLMVIIMIIGMMGE